MKISLPGTVCLYVLINPELSLMIPNLFPHGPSIYEVLSRMFQKLGGDVAIRDRHSFDLSRRLSVSILVNISSVLSTAFSSLLPALDLSTFHVFDIK